MKHGTWIRWAGLVTGSAVFLQLGACVTGDFWIRVAGAGAVVSGLVNLIAT